MKEMSAVSEPMTAQVSWLQKHGLRTFAAVFWLLLIGLYAGYAVRNDFSPLATMSQLLGFLSGSVYGPLLFILLYTLRPLVFFSALVLTVGAGFLYGPVLGVLYAVIGANLGASLAFFIGTFFGRGMLTQGWSRNSGEAGRLQRYADGLRRNAFETVLTMRFLFLPFDLVNYLAGFLRVSYAPFILATVLGSLPGTVAFVLFGASVDGLEDGLSSGLPSVDARTLATSALLFAASLTVSRVLKQRERRREGKGDKPDVDQSEGQFGKQGKEV